ncbi:class I SAM-dependent methyltransferase [Chromobacterium subtsugae]|uniref:class I SAM-dependent methyltransferase n=1 Tax=Chromobacterium subtsugae TaxID=251747 RepID=UPI000640DDBF|nr:class I SAM-dependent methyltransferase [Chromobacterium subtsugae]OBU87932.1 SAM-dependent methyltransferase [Chromobacterium subtsugae]
MTQNIYDTPEFFHGYSQLNRSVHGLAGAPEWPSLRALLPALQGAAVADLGCGYGWFCRWAREAGASAALGLDVSEKMLAQAAAMTRDDAIEYRRQNLETLQLPPAAFDLVYSSLTLHYIADLAGLLAACHRALKPGGRLVFSIEHPIFMAARQPAWLQDAQGGRCWPVSGYQDEGPRVTHWLTDGVIKQHRTLGTLLNQVMAAGFALRHIEDWGPSAEQVAAMPELAEERERPMLLLVSAQR